MIFLFEDILSGATLYVIASDICEALEKFERLKESGESDFGSVHVYVRIM